MATVVNNQPPDRIVEVDRSDSSAGWAIAVIVLILVIAGLFFWYRYYQPAPQAPQNGSANINVTIPAGGTNTGSSGGTPGGTSGGTGY